MASEKVVKRVFSAKTLLGHELPYGAPEGGEVVSDRIVGMTRWSAVHEIIWRFADTPPGFAWRATYNIASTEQQEERPWQYAVTVEATYVQLVVLTVQVWEPVAADAEKAE